MLRSAPTYEADYCAQCRKLIPVMDIVDGRASRTLCVLHFKVPGDALTRPKLNEETKP